MENTGHLEGTGSELRASLRLLGDGILGGVKAISVLVRALCRAGTRSDSCSCTETVSPRGESEAEGQGGDAPQTEATRPIPKMAPIMMTATPM